MKQNLFLKLLLLEIPFLQWKVKMKQNKAKKKLFGAPHRVFSISWQFSSKGHIDAGFFLL